MTLTRPLSYYSWPAGIIVFFIILASVNAFIFMTANAGRPALVEENPYEKGLAYQNVIDRVERARQRELSAEITVLPGGDNGARRVRVNLLSGATPLTGETVYLKAMRADNPILDTEANLIEADAGKYAAQIKLPVAGLWLIEIEVGTGEKSALLKERVVIP